MGLSVIQISVGGYDKNFSYLVYDDESQNTVVVDPSGDLDKILETIKKHELNLVGILITHTHQDHIDKLTELLKMYAVPVYVHQSGSSSIVSSNTIFPIRDRETLILGSRQLTVIYTPGHTEDSICFYIDTANSADDIPKLITGDTLFVGGCGRTDKHGVQSLYNSLIRLKALPDDTIVYAGHDYGNNKISTIGKEKESNRYLLAENFEEFKQIRINK